MSYYMQQNQLKWLAPVHRDGFSDKPYDYYMIHYDEDEYARHHKIVLIDSKECMFILARDSIAH